MLRPFHPSSHQSRLTSEASSSNNSSIYTTCAKGARTMAVGAAAATVATLVSMY